MNEEPKNMNFDEWNRMHESWNEILADYDATKEYFSNVKLEDYVKSQDAIDFIQEILEYYIDGDILLAHWIENEFAIEFVVTTDKFETASDFKEDLLDYPLEDTVYEAMNTNGWTIKTLNNTYEYCTIDFRKKSNIYVKKF
jgi:hypothetical protein